MDYSNKSKNLCFIRYGCYTSRSLISNWCSSSNSKFMDQNTSLSAQPYSLGTSTRKCLEDLETENQSMSSVSRNNREYGKLEGN
ncbi:hypothetical protein L873DRAFT_671692 [Choiromyces venosus 120613-1]|uniref:Uncharacterized protein n=1 Tax=Choiromyces venosus 120613-1 TaxID=1336337 RepID=A0A3N4JSG3_9PEZI|nr:hypothetical protein L873DRAFT_671692 [Choiromyces venosus 120613-1]